MNGQQPLRGSAGRGRPWLAARALAAATLVGLTSSAAAAPALHLVLDRSHLLEVRDPLVTVAVANPAVADIHVVAPDQILILARAVGATSLVVFHAARTEHLEIVVHPPPPADRAYTGALIEAPHGVLVLRAEKASRQVFTRDGHDAWVELGAARSETEPRK